jgi:hypothetical protein
MLNPQHFEQVFQISLSMPGYDNAAMVPETSSQDKGLEIDKID